MSLINKMLQDLDARGGAPEDAVHPQDVKAVPPVERDRRPMLIGGAAVGLLVLAAGGWYGWHQWQARSAPPPGPAPKIVDQRPPKQSQQASGEVGGQAGPARSPATDAAAASGAAAGVGSGTAQGGRVQPTAAAASSSPVDASAMTASSATPAGVATPATSPTRGDGVATRAASPARGDGVAIRAASPVEGDSAASRAASPAGGDGDAASHSLPTPVVAAGARSSKPAAGRVTDSPRSALAEQAGASQARKPASAQHAAAAGEGVVMRDLTPKQMSENSYRRALAALQEGRVSAALADLDKAVDIDPRNDAARQTYVSLLLENRRTEDAIRQLRLALGVEPRQPGLAMVLARLQLEKGGPALETLQKTLPYAGNNAEYLGFLAGVLQREQRHAEAAEQYRNALALAPDNAVWWMGLGISLQAEQHLPEAREAYRRAIGGAGLTPELKAFIDRKLDQLSR